MSAVHESAVDGFSRGARAYSRGRPGYPNEVEEWLGNELGLTSASTAIDLGAGTGKFTGHLARTGARVTAVEPVAAMLRELRAKLPEIEAKSGNAHAIPAPSGSADAVTCAQAFHWFADDRALREIRRVLKPGGRLGLVWNVRDETVGWVAALTGIMAPFEGTTPRFHEGLWRKLFPAEGFAPLEERGFLHSHDGPPEQVIVERILSVSFMAALGAAEKQAVAAQIRDLIADTPELAGRPTVGFPYRTLAVWTHKIP